MKRLNPDVGKPFKYGDTREDGYRFLSYNKSYIRKDGLFGESWLSPDKFERHNQRNNKAARERYRKNPEHKRKMNRRHFENNRGYYNAKTAKRWAAKLERTVAWADLEAINDKYTTARYLTELTGEQYHVDHIVPLQGATVSGLHVEYNLRVVTAKENLSKGNLLMELRK